jgi:hypothetical protein
MCRVLHSTAGQREAGCRDPKVTLVEVSLFDDLDSVLTCALHNRSHLMR